MFLNLSYIIYFRFVPKSKGFRPIEQLKEIPTIKYSPELSAREYLKIVNRVLVCVTKSCSFGFGIHSMFLLQ